jgi:arylformamidase
VAFTDESVKRLSPARHAQHLRCPALVAHGSLESPQFQWQAQTWEQALGHAHVPVRGLQAQGLNHFEILETLGHHDGLLAQAVLGLIQGRA